MTKDDKINLLNFKREIEIKKLKKEEAEAKYTNEFPLEELKALSIEGLELEIKKINDKYKN